jgi:predicted O-methyltransferase YrrM
MGPFTLIAALWLKFLRTRVVGFWDSQSVLSDKIFLLVGVFPIVDHYYEPLFNPKRLRYSLRQDRLLPGINLNVPFQLSLLKEFRFNKEILEIKARPSDQLTFDFANSSYQSGDAEFLYNVIRHFKPQSIIEIGSGYSTLMAQHSLSKNKEENINYMCAHTCIEPFAHNWLENLPVKIVRKMVEEVDLKIFCELKENDILFIDSSHIIRPQGDVLLEYLTILPSLAKGVLVHVHDIFTPKDYLDQWLLKGKVFWNEQYLLEAFLSNNDAFEIIGALNYLKHNHYDDLAKACPLLTRDREPGSFWMKKRI